MSAKSERARSGERSSPLEGTITQQKSNTTTFYWRRRKLDSLSKKSKLQQMPLNGTRGTKGEKTELFHPIHSIGLWRYVRGK